MPSTIRQTLLARLQASPVLNDLRTDLEAMAGVRLRLVGPFGKGAEATVSCSESLLCERVRSLPRGCAHCRRFTEEMVVESGGERAVSGECDAGLTTYCVPLRMGGETLAYLLAGGYRTGESDPAARNRLRHLLARLGVADESAALVEFEEETLYLAEARHEALRRWLQLAADALIRSLELREGSAGRPLPTFITRICAVIQNKYQSPPTLGEAAAICGLSEGYFCRAFHEFTGLRFLEYVHAVRIEHVCEQLLHSEDSITDTAFACGFQSLSQFNRVFRKLKGVSPRQWRQTELARSAVFAS